MEPQYLKIYKKLRTRIVEGDYRYGDRLPSKRVLAEEHRVSVITAQHAYELLCEEGYVQARQRSGFFVSYRAEDGFALPEEKMSFPAAMPAADAVAFPYPELAKTARFVLTEYQTALLQKTEKTGAAVLRHAIAEYLARNRGLRVDPAHILIGSGAEYLYGIMIQLLGRGRVYGIEDPSYEKIRQVYRGNGVCCRLLAMGEDGILSSELAATEATVLHITPYHSFPTGITASASKRSEYIRWSAAGDRYLIEDDYESEFTLSAKVEETLLSLDRRERVIYLNTFTRTVSPAIRVAYAVLPEHLVKKYDEQLGYLSCPVPTFEQLLVAELLRKGAFERHINRARRNLRRAETERRGR